MAAICAAAPLALANQLPLPTIVACPGQGRLPTLRTRRCLGHSTGSSDAAGNVQDGTGWCWCWSLCYSPPFDVILRGACQCCFLFEIRKFSVLEQNVLVYRKLSECQVPACFVISTACCGLDLWPSESNQVIHQYGLMNIPRYCSSRLRDIVLKYMSGRKNERTNAADGQPETYCLRRRQCRVTMA